MSTDSFVASQGRLNVLCFPADDLVLRKRVRDAVEAESAADARAFSERLRISLRVVYPRIEVRVRDPLAGFGDPTLYVFRDGGIASKLGSQSWMDEPNTARMVTSAAGLYVEANEAAGELFGLGRDEIIGHPAGTFTEPDARIDDPQKLWATLEASGELHSLAVIHRSDARVRVEFITHRNADGQGRHVTWLRPVG